MMQFPTSRATPTALVSQGFEFDLENIDIFFLFYIYIFLNDKITIIVNLQYRKGFLYWCWKEKEWKYYIILSHLM